MSGIAHLAFVVTLGFLMLPGLSGCCGSTPSHYCDFKAGLSDGGDTKTDTGQMTCYGETCKMPEVCCVRDTPPYANCVDISRFQELGCREPPAMTCTQPSECSGGQVCCLKATTASISITCMSPDMCPGEGLGVDGTAWVCNSINDCPAFSEQCVELVDPSSNRGSGIFTCN